MNATSSSAIEGNWKRGEEKQVKDQPVIGRGLRFETATFKAPVSGQPGISLITEPASPGPSGAWPECGQPPEHQTGGRRKRRWSYSWCFESRRKSFMRRPRRLVTPTEFRSQSTHKMCCTTVRRVRQSLFSARSRFTRSSRGRLVSKFVAWAQLSKPWARESFVVSDGHLIKTGYIQSLARGRSSSNEAQASGCEWK
jgi:hypothetical protein